MLATKTSDDQAEADGEVPERDPAQIAEFVAQRARDAERRARRVLARGDDPVVDRPHGRAAGGQVRRQLQRFDDLPVGRPRRVEAAVRVDRERDLVAVAAAHGEHRAEEPFGVDPRVDLAELLAVLAYARCGARCRAAPSPSGCADACPPARSRPGVRPAPPPARPAAAGNTATGPGGSAPGVSASTRPVPAWPFRRSVPTWYFLTTASDRLRHLRGGAGRHHGGPAGGSVRAPPPGGTRRREAGLGGVRQPPGARRRRCTNSILSSIGAISPRTPATCPAICSGDAACVGGVPAAGRPVPGRTALAGSRGPSPKAGRGPGAVHPPLEVGRDELHPAPEFVRQLIGLLLGRAPERPLGGSVREQGDRGQRHDGNGEERQRQPGAERHRLTFRDSDRRRRSADRFRPRFGYNTPRLPKHEWQLCDPHVDRRLPSPGGSPGRIGVRRLPATTVPAVASRTRWPVLLPPSPGTPPPAAALDRRRALRVSRRSRSRRRSFPGRGPPGAWAWPSRWPAPSASPFAGSSPRWWWRPCSRALSHADGARPRDSALARCAASPAADPSWRCSWRCAGACSWCRRCASSHTRRPLQRLATAHLVAAAVPSAAGVRLLHASSSVLTISPLSPEPRVLSQQRSEHVT